MSTKCSDEAIVQLSRLSGRVLTRLKHGPYIVNTGTAWTSSLKSNVSPLKITVRKGKKGNIKFAVVKKPSYSLQEQITMDGGNSNEAAEDAAKLKEKEKDESKEKLLERLNGLGGISLARKSERSGDDSKPSSPQPSGISIASKSTKTLDINHFRSLQRKQPEEAKEDTKPDPSKLLARFSGISVATKAKPDDKVTTTKERDEKENKTGDNKGKDANDNAEDGDDNDKEADINKNLLKSSSTVATVTSTTTVAAAESAATSTTTITVASAPKTPTPPLGNADRVRVASNLFPNVIKKEVISSDDSENVEASKAKMDKPDTTKAETSELITASIRPKIEPETTAKEGIDILKGMAEQLNSNATLANSAVQVEDDDDIVEVEITEETQVKKKDHKQQQQPSSNNQNFSASAAEPDSSNILQPQVSSSDSLNQPYLQTYLTDQQNLQDGAEYVSLDRLGQTMPDQQQQQDVAYVDSTAALQEHQQQQQQPTEQTDSTLLQSVQPEGIGARYLQGYLTEQQQPEYLSLDHLGRGLDGQQPVQQSQPTTSYIDPNAPMEQLTQQVQRLPNPITVIPQQQMQGVPMHPGMGIPGHQQIPPQPAQPFDPQMQIQGMSNGMPTLYQGFPVLMPQYNNQAQPPQPSQQQVQQAQGQQPVTPTGPPPMTMGQPCPTGPPGGGTGPPRFSVPQSPPRPPALQRAPTFHNMNMAPRRPRMPVKRNLTATRMQTAQSLVAAAKQRRVDQARITLHTQAGPPKTTLKKNPDVNKVTDVLSARGITVMQSSARQASPQQRSPLRNTPAALLNLGSNISITPTSSSRSSNQFATPQSPRRSTVVNNNVERPVRCDTVDLTIDDEPTTQSPRSRISLGRFTCNICNKLFNNSAALEAHKANHRASGVLAYSCDKCKAKYPSAAALAQHNQNSHRNWPQPDVAIPVIDLSDTTVREKLRKCGINHAIPLSQLQCKSNGTFALPILNLDSAKIVTDINLLGASNLFSLGKLKTCPR